VAAALAGGCGAAPREAPLPAAPAGVVRDDAPMVLVPAGPFLRGAPPGERRAALGDGGPAGASPEAQEPDDLPARTLHLDAFFIDKFEVTNRAYARFIAETGRPAPHWDPAGPRWGGEWGRFSWAGRRPPPGASDLPATLVTWFDAEAYCAWAGKRLPTEAEWEKAARGTDGRRFPWGEEGMPSPAHGNFGRRHPGPLPGGSFPGGASPYGAMDMAGNVAEWVADYYDPRHYAQAPSRNPRGPERGALRAVRGGFWGHSEEMARTYRRWFGVPTHSHGGVGFRCARSAGR